VSQIYALMGWSQAIEACERKDPDFPPPVYDAAAQTTYATVGISVKRSLDGLARAMDPQNWDECSALFVKTHVAKRTNGDYAVDSEFDVEPALQPPTPGTTWNSTASGALFEHFEMSWGNLVTGTGFARFKNLLEITTLRDTASFRVSYVLDRSLGSRVAYQSVIGLPYDDSGPGGLDVDEGVAEVTDLGAGWLRSTGKKTLRLSSRPGAGAWLNLWTPAFLAALGGEVEEGVCCAVEDPAPPSPGLDRPGEPILIP
jgi:hypothetical protein